MISPAFITALCVVGILIFAGVIGWIAQDCDHD